MIVKSFCAGVLNQYEARENGENQDHPPFGWTERAEPGRLRAIHDDFR
jgi:hypothetical protein